MYDILYLFKGMLVGLMVSIPLGPMGVLIIQKTLHKGALSGFIAGMGAASADLFYAAVAAFGLGFVINIVQAHELLLQIIGGIFLIVIGLKIYFDNPIRQIRQRRQGRVSKTGLLGDYLSLFFLTVSNPITVVVFMAVFAGMSVFGESSSLLGEVLVVAGVLLGGGVWWYTLSTLVNIFRKKFRLRVLITINRVSGMIITILGALVILSAFAPFKNLVIQ
ncbi:MULTISPECIES: LysE family translocator [Butyricimonas]|uniref:LysE family transporter n=1 Tax=Butyricimonas hominis TaxID=2763032 RepID=A0ABR7D7V6_9BACT|nr:MULTISPECIES: LysE family transporter [Butyricimonas]MBC5623415.1 LysE family transporter [Butyricimonas hominis]MCB6973233.1 LysE family transporter [Butyricimonas synergistica]MCG4519849.1 LysE family transporter [Butyricimonas sp. DFI.6.44]